MIHSMTGYGKSVLQLPTKKITIELKSLNSKNLDLNARMPSIYREKELAIRKSLANKLVRGKVDFSILNNYRLNEGKVLEIDFNNRIDSIHDLLDQVIAIDPERVEVRLKNHLNYFKESINSEDSNGKKLGFISQEMGREINTIGSKSNYAPMQQLVVQMKDELEKIKEQFKFRILHFCNLTR